MNDILFEGIGMTSRRTRERLIGRLMEQGISNLQVLDTIRDTPRHIFIDEALAHRAYEDTALPIGYNQTISQPYIVARMTELLLAEGPRPRVLEVGTGSGYQTAILAQLVEQLYTVERIKPLQDRARSKLRQLKLHNVQLRHTDGGMGWPEQAPFDAIMVTAAPDTVPNELMEQLSVGGVLIIPVGEQQQQLKRIQRLGESDYQTDIIEDVHFVPLLSGVIR